MGVLTQTPGMGKRRSAADFRGATNQHKSESPASQQAGSTNLDALQPAELNVVADDMGDVLHETRSPSPAGLDAWARARHRRDRASGSRQSDGRTGAETRLGKGGGRVGEEWG